MSFSIMLYSANKKLNSTKRLSDNVGYYARFMCNMNSGGSLLNMSIILNPDDKAEIFTLDGTDISNEKNPFDSDIVAHWKYAYSFTLNRWYLITDIVYNSGLWYVSLAVDVLATYRDVIGKSVQLVSRCEKLVEPWIEDTLLPITERINIQNRTLPNINTVFNEAIAGSENMYYIMLVNSSQKVSARGMLTAYVLSYAQLLEVNQYLLENPQTYTGVITDVTDNMLKALINPLQYIVSVKAYCFKPPVKGGVAGMSVKLAFGFWKTSIEVLGYLDHSKESWTDVVAIPDHPDLTDTRKYLNQAPYSTIKLDFLPFYQGEIDSTYFQFGRTIALKLDVDLYTGDAVLSLMARSGTDTNAYKIFQTFNANVALDIPVSQVASNNLASEVASVVADVSKKNASLATDVAKTTLQAARANYDYSQGIEDYMGYGGDYRYALANANFSIGGILGMPINAELQKRQLDQASTNALFNTRMQGLNVQSAENTERSIAAQNMYSTIAAKMPIVGTRGYYSNLLNLTTAHLIYFEFWKQAESRPSVSGRPWFHYDKIEDCGGYCEVVNPVVDFGLAAENSMIERFMSNGFFYE